jgi:hypothetical protein
MMAILTACAVSGFYPGTGHCFRVTVPAEDCTAAIERAASDMADAGMVVRFTRCDGTVTNQARASHDR